MAQPAERISSVPTTKMITMSVGGRPCAASHTAHSVGQSRSSAPIGLSSLISRSYASKRLRSPAVFMGARRGCARISGAQVIGPRPEPALDVAPCRLRIVLEQLFGSLDRFLDERPVPQ